MFFILRRILSWTYIDLNVKYHYSCQILMKLECSRQIFERYSNIKFHENRLTRAGLSYEDKRTNGCSDEQTDRRKDGRTERQTWWNQWSLFEISRTRLKTHHSDPSVYRSFKIVRHLEHVFGHTAWCSGIGNGGKQEAADIPMFLQRREKH